MTELCAFLAGCVVGGCVFIRRLRQHDGQLGLMVDEAAAEIGRLRAALNRVESAAQDELDMPDFRHTVAVLRDIVTMCDAALKE